MIVYNNPEFNNTHNFRIMVVDDEKDITMTYTQYLQEGGFIVEAYNSPYEA